MDAQRLAQEDSFENETFTDLDLQRADLGQKEFYRCPATNRIKATHVPVETAVLLAQSLGMRVAGVSGDAGERPSRKRSRS